MFSPTIHPDRRTAVATAESCGGRQLPVLSWGTFHMRRRHLVAGLGLLVLSGSVTANPLPVPTADYSADRVMETAEGTISQKIYVSGTKERAEMDMGGMQIANIRRGDKNLIWTLMPMQRMYQEMSFDSPAAKQGGGMPTDVTITEAGSETVEGMATTKYKMILKDKTAGGFVWITSDHNIPIKMDMLSKESGQKTRVKMTLQNLKIGKQDPSLFEIPAGYNKMPSMGNFGGMMPGR